ncbi:MAG TPA: PLP-dependent aspartate aminotransferase family protein [Blastocatellia bacterium]|nr:PLP-dependent aspartate aminotransferase family protein [Blastocatellia bacterium]
MKRPKKPRRDYHKETRLIHGEFHSLHWDYRDHIVPPITASAAYRLESAERGAEGFQEFANPEFNRHTHPPIYIYDRLDEPSRSMLEDNLATAEGAECAVCFATGMAAISAALGVLVKTGDTILSHHTLYGCTYSLLTNWMPRFGVKTKMANLRDVAALPGLLTDDVMAVYFETPTNPTMELIDIAAIRRAVDEANAWRGKARKIFIVVDNTFATPFCQRPISLGADVVCHSLTKNIGGFGTDMGGVWIGPELLEPDVLLYRKDFGSPLSPKAAWPALVYGLPTLALRSRHQIETAMKVAAFLEHYPAVERVLYPGLESHPQYALARKQMIDVDGNFAPGIMIYFVLKGSPEDARETGRRMMDHLADRALAVTLAVSLGQIRTLIEHPASMTHAAIPVADQLKAGIDPGGIRLSTGLETSDDIVGDLEEALNEAAPSRHTRQTAGR